MYQNVQIERYKNYKNLTCFLWVWIQN